MLMHIYFKAYALLSSIQESITKLALALYTKNKQKPRDKKQKPKNTMFEVVFYN